MTQCGRFGQTDCTKARCTGWFTEDRVTGKCCAGLFVELSLIDLCSVSCESAIICDIFVYLYIDRIPFFFEPNFTANVVPLRAALRLLTSQDKESSSNDKQTYKSVVYGDFLLRKVDTNFALDGKGKYD
jgi:hypothetical protein